LLEAKEIELPEELKLKRVQNSSEKEITFEVNK
jgi:hypothetical protein